MASAVQGPNGHDALPDVRVMGFRWLDDRGVERVERIPLVDHGTGILDEFDTAFRFFDDAVEANPANAPYEFSAGSPGEDVALKSPHRTDVLRFPRLAVAGALLSERTRLRLVAEASPHLHAAALCDSDGNGVLLVGPSGVGKSTLTARLAAEGLLVLNDEQVGLHPQLGVVSGFTRPVSIKPGGHQYVEPLTRARPRSYDHLWLIDPAQLGSDFAVSARPTVVILLGPDADRPSVRRVSSAEAVAACCDNNLDLVRDVEASLAAYLWLVQTAQCYEITNGRNVRAGELIELLARNEASPAGPPTTLRRPKTDGTTTEHARRRPVFEIDFGTEMVLYEPASRAVVRLNEDGAAVWRRLDSSWDPPVDQDAFVEALIRAGVVA